MTSSTHTAENMLSRTIVLLVLNHSSSSPESVLHSKWQVHMVVAYTMTARAHVPGEWHEISSDPELSTVKASEATGHSVQIHPYSAFCAALRLLLSGQNDAWYAADKAQP